MERLRFTEQNESLIRQLLFDHWCTYYARRRQQTLKEMSGLTQRHARYRELAETRYARWPEPADLSGACKIAAQVAIKLFDLDGEVISNPRHTFIVLAGGEIYDFNRRCRDVNSMAACQRAPYQIDRAFNQSPKAIGGRNSWASFLEDFFAAWAQRQATRKIILQHTGPSVTELPLWARLPIAPTISLTAWQRQVQQRR